MLIHTTASETSLNNDKRKLQKKESLCVYKKLAEWPASYQSKKLFLGETLYAKLHPDVAFSCGGNLIANDKPGRWPCCSCGASCPDNLVDADCSCVARDPAIANTKYPVVFAPSRISLPSASAIDRINRFGGLLEYLEAMGGANVFSTTTTLGVDTTDQCNTIADCAATFKTQVLQILANTGSVKVNIIAHLDAGLYVRYAITNLGLSSKISSVTTINTPHRGSALFEFELAGVAEKSIASALGIEEEYVQNVFNPGTPNVSGLYYQSFSSMVDPFWTASTKEFLSQYTGENVERPDTVEMSRHSDIRYSPFLANTAWILFLITSEGNNDGISSETSHKWGNYRGLVSPAFDHATGIDAFQAINDLSSGQDFWSVNLFYLNLLNDLKNRDF